MNQQMYLLEARAMARERERSRQHSRRNGASKHRNADQSSARRLALLSLGRVRAARAAGGGRTAPVAARG